jgi:type IV secretion system protein VirB1
VISVLRSWKFTTLITRQLTARLPNLQPRGEIATAETLRIWQLAGPCRPFRFAVACLLPAMAVLPTAGRAERLNVASFTDLARRCGSSVDPFTLAAVAKTESNFRTLVVSDNSSRRAREFDSLDQAVALADNLVARGHSIDLGLMQINSANLRRLGYTSRDALDPCKSISGGALILSRNYASIRNVGDPQVALRHALSQYNTGNIHAGYRNGYVRRVEQAARLLLLTITASPPATQFARTAAPFTRQVLAASWNVWGGAERSVAPPKVLRSESLLVF